MFYASVTYKDESATEVNQFGTDIWVNDLFRFDSRKARDLFVEETSWAKAITRKAAEIEYREQFNYWKTKQTRAK